MNILIISNVFPPKSIGGYELGCEDIANSLHTHGETICVMTSDIFLDEGAHPYKVLRTLKHASTTQVHSPEEQYNINWQNLRLLEHRIECFCPDLIIAFNLEGLGTLGILGLLSLIKLPVILYLMDNIFRHRTAPRLAVNKWKEIAGPVLGANMHVVAMSRRLVGEIELETGLSIPNYTLIPGWYRNNGQEKRSVCSGKFRADCASFIFVSRVAPHKGTELLLDAISILKERGIESIHVDVFGDGELSQFLTSTKVKGVESYVTYRGALTKEMLANEYKNYDALIFPTWEREPFGFVVSEAMGRGLVPLLTKGTGAAEWLKHGINSIQFERNAWEIASAMEFYLHMTVDKKQDLSLLVTKYAEEIFSFEKCLWQLRNLIEDMIPSRGTGHLSRQKRRATRFGSSLEYLLQDILL